MYSARGLTSAADRGHSGNSAAERNHRLASTADRSQNNAGGADRSHSHASTAERSGSNAGERSSPGAVRRGGEAGRQSRMDATGFRFRLRKGGGEGVTKKGPMVSTQLGMNKTTYCTIALLSDVTKFSDFLSSSNVWYPKFSWNGVCC